MGADSDGDHGDRLVDAVPGVDGDEEVGEPVRHEARPWELWDSGPVEQDLRRSGGVLWAALRFAWQADRRSCALMIANDVFGGITAGVQVVAFATVLQRLLRSGDPATLVRSAVPWLILSVAASTVSNVTGAYVRGRAELFQERVGHATTTQLVEVASNIDLLAFESPAFYDRLQRVEAQSAFRPVQVVQSMTVVLAGIAGSVGVIVALFVLKPWLILLTVGVYVPLIFAMNRAATREYEFVRTMSTLERRRMYVRMLLTDRFHAKEVRAFGLRDHLLVRHQQLWQERERELDDVVRHKTRVILRGTALSAVLEAVVAASMLALIGTSRLTIATAGAVLNGVWQLRARFSQVPYGLSGLFEASLFLNDRRELLELAASLDRDRPTAPAPPPFEHLRVEEVSFIYPGAARPAVDNVTMDIKRGEIIALVGENGSGKTTLAKLLGHLYEPSTGRITWDGVNVADVDSAQLRRSMTVVFQDFARFNFTASDNIGLGDVTRRHDRPAITEAARQAGADATIAKLTDGYDTILGRMFEGGHDLSVGQWQRVAVARAFFRDAPFVVLDEPTASLDARAEHELFQRIRALFTGRTVLLISHRFSTVRTADRIYVLHHGRIVERGTHRELMELDQRYAELFNLQAEAFIEQT